MEVILLIRFKYLLIYFEYKTGTVGCQVHRSGKLLFADVKTNPTAHWDGFECDFKSLPCTSLAVVWYSM